MSFTPAKVVFARSCRSSSNEKSDVSLLNYPPPFPFCASKQQSSTIQIKKGRPHFFPHPYPSMMENGPFFARAISVINLFYFRGREGLFGFFNFFKEILISDYSEYVANKRWPGGGPIQLLREQGVEVKKQLIWTNSFSRRLQ